jgi:hypothetical protein
MASYSKALRKFKNKNYESEMRGTTNENELRNEKDHNQGQNMYPSRKMLEK